MLLLGLLRLSSAASMSSDSMGAYMYFLDGQKHNLVVYCKKSSRFSEANWPLLVMGKNSTL